MEILGNNKPLVALICGFEHSGTTLVSEILRQHPQLDSGFEGGFLLNEEASKFLSTEPFYTNSKGGWGINDDDLSYICAANTWVSVYRRLRERASVIEDKSLLLFDKTPRYMQHLTDVLNRVPKVPCIVTVKDFRALMWSSFKRTNFTVEEWYEKRLRIALNHSLSYAYGWKKAMNTSLQNRILLVQYENLCLNPVQEGKKILEFLGFEFDESYLSFGQARYQHVYGSNVSTDYLTEYKDNLPDYVCREVVKLTYEYKDWLWED
ncbi:MAG: sulfotransferase [Microcoleaceae cyanobacterium MO_207.B10]|nr:sulfotransferase [Microcoleaceae cyanobacterium MO_207.B10]